MISAARADPCPLSITGGAAHGAQERRKHGPKQDQTGTETLFKDYETMGMFQLEANEKRADKIPYARSGTGQRRTDPGTLGIFAING
jgi:hypothetical protein